MNDEELRAFLESATVGGPDPEDEKDAPARPSFDELIGLRRQQAPAVEPDPVPLVLPEPRGSSAPEPGVTPLLLPPPGAPAAPMQATPPRPAMPRPSAPVVPPVQATPATVPPPTQPLSRDELPLPPATPAPAQSVAPPTQPLIPPVMPAPFEAAGFVPPAANDQDADYEKIAVTGGPSGVKRFLPWLVVGGGAIVVLVAALLVVGGVRGGGEPATTAAPSTPSSAPSTATTPPPTTPEETSEPTESPADEPPQVEVGQTMRLDIPQWGITADLSTRFGQTSYMIDANNRLVLTSALIDSLPESCAAMRAEWGIVKVEAAYEVLKPAERCAAAPEVYDELWGLTAAIVESIQPL